MPCHGNLLGTADTTYARGNIIRNTTKGWKKRSSMVLPRRKMEKYPTYYFVTKQNATWNQFTIIVARLLSFFSTVVVTRLRITNDYSSQSELFSILRQQILFCIFNTCITSRIIILCFSSRVGSHRITRTHVPRPLQLRIPHLFGCFCSLQSATHVGFVLQHLHFVLCTRYFVLFCFV